MVPFVKTVAFVEPVPDSTKLAGKPEPGATVVMLTVRLLPLFAVELNVSVWPLVRFVTLRVSLLIPVIVDDALTVPPTAQSSVTIAAQAPWLPAVSPATTAATSSNMPRANLLASPKTPLPHVTSARFHFTIFD